MNRVFESMGTVVSLAGSTIDLESVFASFDERFSLYRESSELSRVAAGSLALTDASDSLRDAYALAVEWRAATGGAFTPHRPDGIIDLNGIVKALAMEAAAAALKAESTLGGWILNVGGDILANGPGELAGITDPAARGQLLTSIRMRPGVCGVATSGIAERGEHIWGRATDFAQVTVMAGDIVTADVLATAIMSGGWDTMNAATATWDIDVLAIDREGNLAITPGMRAAVAAAAGTLAA
jgi:thiamine biosynthesis lipoprotein